MQQRDWESFLHSWSAALIGYARVHSGEFSDAEASTLWLGMPAATNAQITEAEHRLGTTFPPSYLEFLQISNGWRFGGVFIDRLYAVEEVGWLRDLLPDLIEGWALGAGEEDESTILLRQALMISPYEDSVLLLIPSIRDNDGEWQAWFFNDWNPGADDFPSFWHLLQHLHQQLASFASADDDDETSTSVENPDLTPKTQAFFKQLDRAATARFQEYWEDLAQRFATEARLTEKLSHKQTETDAARTRAFATVFNEVSASLQTILKRSSSWTIGDSVQQLADNLLATAAHESDMHRHEALRECANRLTNRRRT
ncbi:MAG: SMI1/KNR4 family protein [Anaerolineae bacterium]